MSKRFNKKNANKKKGSGFVPYTDRKLPDGTRMYKMFKQTDEESHNSVEMARYLLRFMDYHMLDAITTEEKDNNGNIVGSLISVYCHDEDKKGDFIFTLGSQYITFKDEDERDEETDTKDPGDEVAEETLSEEDIREKNVSHNEGETSSLE